MRRTAVGAESLTRVPPVQRDEQQKWCHIASNWSGDGKDSPGVRYVKFKPESAAKVSFALSRRYYLPHCRRAHYRSTVLPTEWQLPIFENLCRLLVRWRSPDWIGDIQSLWSASRLRRAYRFRGTARNSYLVLSTLRYDGSGHWLNQWTHLVRTFK